MSFELTISALAAICSVHSAYRTVMKRELHEKMYHSETNTFCYVWKSKIRITDSYEFIRHMHECQFNFVYLYSKEPSHETVLLSNQNIGLNGWIRN